MKQKEEYQWNWEVKQTRYKKWECQAHQQSQTNVAKTIDLTQVSSDEEMEDDTGFQAAVAVKQGVTDDYGDDNIFRGLRNHDSDENDDIPPHFTPPESSDSDREDSVLVEDIIELDHNFDQQRGRRRV